MARTRLPATAMAATAMAAAAMAAAAMAGLTLAWLPLPAMAEETTPADSPPSIAIDADVNELEPGDTVSYEVRSPTRTPNPTLS